MKTAAALGQDMAPRTSPDCAVGLIKSKGANCVTQKIRELIQNTQLVFDYLKITKTSCAVGFS
jgi:hypothetical protein